MIQAIQKIQKHGRSIQQRLSAWLVAVCTVALLSVPAFASGISAPGETLDPALFDPLVSGVTSNVSAILPKVIVIVGLLIGLGVVIGLIKKHARPS